MMLVTYDDLVDFGKISLKAMAGEAETAVHVKDRHCPVCCTPLFALTDGDEDLTPALLCLDCKHQEGGNAW